MTEIIDHAQMIFSDAVANHNKVWKGTLYDNGDVLTEWGRVGYPLQSKLFPSKGLTFFNKKKREKADKGYTELRVLSDAPSTSTVSGNGLHAIATEQIAKANDPVLVRLIKQLVDSNIHQITSSTQLSYNANSGLFSTPLGIVTIDAIAEARACLDEIANGISNSFYDDENFLSSVSSYMRLIPQYVGMRLDVRALFPDMNAIQKQNNILDSLEASYQAAIAAPQKFNLDVPREKVFSVDVNTINNTNDASRLTDWFEKSKKRMHGYDNVRAINVFSVDIDSMTRQFNNGLGNIREVFHGTSQANCLSILKSGLHVSPPSTARIAGKMFGNGIYGAINSTKSLGYTYGRWGQGGVGESGWLFICDFAVGRTYETTRASNLPNGYDSVWGKAGVSLQNDELIVYNERQVRIKYLLECK